MNAEQVENEISGSPEFQVLRHAHRRSGVRMTSAAVGGFLLYVLLSSFTPGLMNTSLSGHLTLGLALGLGQFALMALIARRRLVHMRTSADPISRGLRTRPLHREPGRPHGPARPSGPGRPNGPARRPAAHRAGGFRTW
ncbi:DUF485 domain-containing protein [Streptomyces sp. NPDC057616]|uniref:DUF485 domain-containing protein n=1 Tax=Streptomyces sp. NPDC057616 TaxID=3346183 RepID=UPI0036A18CF2